MRETIHSCFWYRHNVCWPFRCQSSSGRTVATTAVCSVRELKYHVIWIHLYCDDDYVISQSFGAMTAYLFNSNRKISPNCEQQMMTTTIAQWFLQQLADQMTITIITLITVSSKSGTLRSRMANLWHLLHVVLMTQCLWLHSDHCGETEIIWATRLRPRDTLVTMSVAWRRVLWAPWSWSVHRRERARYCTNVSRCCWRWTTEQTRKLSWSSSLEGLSHHLPQWTERSNQF